MIRISTLTVCLAFVAAYAGAQTIDAGKRQFQARCVSCHGEDGTGGARGVTIVDVARPRATSKEAVRDLIAKGIPNRGMPAFSISDDELDSIAAYVVSLRPSARNTPAAIDSAPGDAAAGERFFAGKGNCTSCHMVRGRGGVLGPDLSNIGRDRTVAQIERALRDPGGAPLTAGLRGDGGAARGGTAAYRAVTVHLRDGRSIRGLAKNESPFDVQLLGVDGELHLLLEEQVAEVVREPSLMPKVDATAGEIRDLVAYLSGLSADPGANATPAGVAETEGGIPFRDVARPRTGAWPTYHGTESGNRFSPLDQIHTGNVERLAPSWMFTIHAAPRDLQVTPVVADGVMYITSVNEAYALDARSGREIWHYSRPRARLASPTMQPAGSIAAWHC